MTSLPNLRAAYGKYVLHNAMEEKYRKNFRDTDSYLPKEPPPLNEAPLHDSWAPGSVCIIGAGAAGLATAIFIHDACELAKIPCPTIDIYEAANRSGGRIYSYQFTDTANPAVHNYYDIGAMRIPDITVMKSTFNMIKYLKDNGQKIEEKEYFYGDPDKREPLMYYHKAYEPETVDENLAPFIRTMKPFFKALYDAKTPTAWEDTFKNICEYYDVYSTRAYLQLGNRIDGARPFTTERWTYKETEIAETFETSTGLFDQAWMETICDYYDFNAASQAKAKWWRLEDGEAKNGMQALTNAMEKHLKSRDIHIKYNSPVTQLVHKETDIFVSVKNGTAVTTIPYESVINTTTMGCFGRMDIKGLHLSDDVLTGIRALNYDRSTKVAIKFETDWWTPLLNKQPSRDSSSKGTARKFEGGVSSTDLPISSVVYPSWQDAGSTVLMVSYAWAQDATRLTSLIPDYKGVTQTKRDPIADLCIRYLAELWAQVPGAPKESDLQKLYQSHHAFAWANDPNSAGAFALFGPGQFSHLYPLMQQPHCRRSTNKVGFYFAGEATSVHHAWISGALDSAYMTVYQWAGIQSQPNPGKEENEFQAKLRELALGEGPEKHVAEMEGSLLRWATRFSEMSN